MTAQPSCFSPSGTSSLRTTLPRTDASVVNSVHLLCSMLYSSGTAAARQYVQQIGLQFTYIDLGRDNKQNTQSMERAEKVVCVPFSVRSLTGAAFAERERSSSEHAASALNPEEDEGIAIFGCRE